MAKVTVSQIHELGLQIRRGQILAWKVQAVFGIEAHTFLDMYLGLMELSKVELISAEQMQALIEGEDEALGIFKVTVDYGQTLEQMIAAGHYDWTNDDITPENFPISSEGKAERELILVHLDREVSTTDEVLVHLDRRDLRLAKIEELLALGASRPELQKEFPIVALGSPWVDLDGRRRFAGLIQFDRGRALDLRRDGIEWDEICRFLAVRKDAK